MTRSVQYMQTSIMCTITHLFIDIAAAVEGGLKIFVIEQKHGFQLLFFLSTEKRSLKARTVVFITHIMRHHAYI